MCPTSTLNSKICANEKAFRNFVGKFSKVRGPQGPWIRPYDLHFMPCTSCFSAGVGAGGAVGRAAPALRRRRRPALGGGGAVSGGARRRLPPLLTGADRRCVGASGVSARIHTLTHTHTKACVPCQTDTKMSQMTRTHAHVHTHHVFCLKNSQKKTKNMS